MYGVLLFFTISGLGLANIGLISQYTSQNPSSGLTSNIWAGYLPRLLLARYSPATGSLLAVDLHVWFSQDEEVFTQQVK